jgi:nitrate/nitrite-specific signal transduction histidine kinase
MKRNEGQRPYIDKVTGDNQDYIQSLLEENQRLTARLETVENESRAFSARYVEVEQQNTNLANLYVATYQLHGTLNREAVLAAIKEIVINLVGSEELAIWELDDETGSLQLVDSFGIDAVLWDRVGLGNGIVGDAAKTGERFVRGESPLTPSKSERTLTAAIPLKLDQRVIGVIGVFALLQQKNGLEAVDYELFDLLASHAASALFCTRIFARVLTTV